MKNTQAQPRRWRRFRPTPALLIAFVALFAAMGGIGYSAAKLRPNSIRSKSIRDGAVTSNKLADGAVTTPKFAADAMAPSARNATNADMLGGVAPGGCQAGWLRSSMTVDTLGLTDQPTSVPGFDCASMAPDAIQISRTDVGHYVVTINGAGADTAVASSAGSNSVVGVTKLDDGSFLSVSRQIKVTIGGCGG